MAQDFYVKLPFYVTEGTVPRYVSVSFGGETVIPKTEITSRDMRNPDILSFNVSKDPSIYDMVISTPDHSFDESGAVILKQFHISPDNNDWYNNTVLGANTDGSTVMTIDLEEANAPHLSTICGFWFGNSVAFKMEIPENWSTRYTIKTIAEALAKIDEQLANPNLPEDVRVSIQENRDKIAALLIATEG